MSFLRFATLFLLTLHIAKAGSMTTCTMWQLGFPETIIMASSGPTHCRVDLTATRYGTADSTGANSLYSLSGFTRAYALNDGEPLAIRIKTEVVSSFQDYLYFANLPADSFLKIGFLLTPLGASDHDFSFTFNGNVFFNDHSPTSLLLPIPGGGPLSLDATLQVTCRATAYCLGGTSYGMNFVDVVDASGVSRTGYSYGFGSGLRIFPSDITFTNGTYDASLPEPSSMLLTLLGIGAVLTTVRRSKRR